MTAVTLQIKPSGRLTFLHTTHTCVLAFLDDPGGSQPQQQQQQPMAFDDNVMMEDDGVDADLSMISLTQAGSGLAENVNVTVVIDDEVELEEIST